MTKPSTALVWRSERSASRTRRSGGRSSSGRASSSSSSGDTSPAPNVAPISGANVSMSGHITITSRGSSVGSSASWCRIASRSTSTWRARPWQAWTWMLRSSPSSSRSSGRPGSGGPGGGTVLAHVGLDARRAASRWPAVVGMVVVGLGGPGPVTQLQLAHVLPPGGEQPVGGQLARDVLGAAGDRRAPARPAPTARATGAAGTGARRAGRPSACSTCSRPAGSRVSPNTDSRSGSSTSPGSSRRRAHADSIRSAGSGWPARARSRRHSSACQRASGGSFAPVASTSLPAAHARIMPGRWSA